MKIDHRLILRAIWHLVWTGEATNDSFESIRHADFTSGLSGCYDLFKKPGREGVTIEYITKHILEYRRLEFISEVIERFEETRQQIDSLLNSQSKKGLKNG
jgi:hypothetical protein